MISKSEFFYGHAYEFDFSGVVRLRLGMGEVVHTMYGGFPGLYFTLNSITGKGFTNVSAIMGCLQVICGHLVIFRFI